MNKFLFAAALIGNIFAGSVAATAQRVIPAVEPIAPDGTYCNVIGFNQVSGLNLSVTLPASSGCGLFTKSLMGFASNTTIWAPLVSSALNPVGNSGFLAPVVTTYAGTTSALNITASSVIKATGGRLFRVSVIVAGVSGSIHDTTTTGAATAANQVATIPAAVGVYEYNWPMSNGIVYILGAGQVIAVNYN